MQKATLSSGTTAAPHPDPHNSTPNRSPRVTTAWPSSLNHRNPRKTKRYAFEINTSTLSTRTIPHTTANNLYNIFEYHSESSLRYNGSRWLGASRIHSALEPVHMVKEVLTVMLDLPSFVQGCAALTAVHIFLSHPFLYLDVGPERYMCHKLSSSRANRHPKRTSRPLQNKPSPPSDWIKSIGGCGMSRNCRGLNLWGWCFVPV